MAETDHRRQLILTANETLPLSGAFEKRRIAVSTQRSLRFLHSLQLGFELFTRAFVVEMRRQSDVIERQSVWGSQRVTLMRSSATSANLLLTVSPFCDARDQAVLSKTLSASLSARAPLPSHPSAL